MSESTGSGKAKGGVLRAASAILDRLRLANVVGKQFGGDRDMYQVFGYKRVLTFTELLGRAERQDIAGRVVNAPPDATWSRPPFFAEESKELQEPFDKIIADINLWTNINRVDKLARIGRVSLLLIGFNDGSKLEQPVNAEAIDKNKPILYLRPISEGMLKQITFMDDATNERFGQPEIYHIAFDEVRNRNFGSAKGQFNQATTSVQREQKVHWTRIIHVTDEQLDDDIIATPTLARVYNLLDDFLKVVGGTAETYWLTSNRGMQVDIDKEMELDADDAEALSDEIEEYQHSLRRFIRTRGTKIQNLGSDPPNPRETFSMLVSMLSGATGIPQRILIGSEAGQLASEQDRANWADRIDERRALYAVPMILRPFVKRLQMFKLIPEGEFSFDWEDAFKMSPLEDAQRMAQIGRTVANLSKQTGSKTPMQITNEEESREIIGLSGPLKARRRAQQVPEEGGTEHPGDTRVEGEQPLEE